jgi:hypothetical protein
MIDDVVGVNVGSSKDGGKTNGVQDDWLCNVYQKQCIHE